MKHSLSYIVCLAALLLGSSCIKDNIVDYPCHDAVLSLAITNAGEESRAGGDGASLGTNDDEYNEDAIKSVDIFLYPASATDATPATKHVSLSYDTREQCDVSQSLNEKELEALGLTGKNANKTCKAYIIVNAPATISALADGAEGTSVTALTNAVVTTSFGETADWDTGKVSTVFDHLTGTYPKIMLKSIKPQEKFVMDSDVVDLTYNQSERTIGRTESVKVVRAAAKIRLTVTLADNIIIGKDTWVPNVEGMSVAFYNGVKSATIGMVEDPEDRTDSEHRDDFFNVAGIQFLTSDLSGAPGFVESDNTGAEGSSVTRATSAVTHITPFYTYPSAWKTDLEEYDAARLELIVPWGIEKSETWDIDYIQYRYSVPINMAEKKIERNKFYNINLHIGVLGNLNYLDPLTYSFKVTEWNSESIDVNLQKPQYLTVEKNYIEVYNQDTFGVAYEASDDITAVITKVVKPNYTAETAVENNVVYQSATGSTEVKPPKFTVGSSSFGNQNPIKVEVKDGQVVLTHILNNNMADDDLDYVPYTITVLVTMKLADGKSITEEVVFKQYPAIYLYADQNAAFDKMYTSENTFNTNNNNPDNIFVNGWSRKTTSRNGSLSNKAPGVENSPSQCGDVYGLYYSSNKNPNQYVITVSSISSDQSYVIADSRSRSSNVSDLDIGTIAKSYAVDYDFNLAAQKRQLTYYYRTIEDLKNGETDKTKPDSFVTGWNIAPKFRIASSYSVTSTTESLDVARKRCATYQENGYPAGRWRMPTYAEVALIASMSDRLMIPRLFSDNRPYWCAHGEFMPNGGEVKLTGGEDAYSIRCVYDEWYWGSKRLSTDTSVTPNYSDFVWGDMQITW